MSSFNVLLTDYAWPDVDIERGIIEDRGGRLIVAKEYDAESLATLAGEQAIDAIMTNWADVPAEVIAASKRCRIVSRLGIGLDNIDVAYCTSQRIPVTNVPDYCVIEVAEHALASLLAMARKIAFYHRETKAERYELQAGPKMRRIEGQTLGIVGLGNIGRRLAEKAIALKLQVLATSRSGKDVPPGVEVVALDELLRRSDYVSLHMPLTPQTKHLIGAGELACMKPTAYLMNTARGGIIDHAALAAALDEGQIAGAALDVQDPEPPDLHQPPYNDPRVIVTPHAAFVSEESLADLRTRTATQVVQWLTGTTPEHVVNPAALD